MNRIALDLGFIKIYWYSITMFLGVLFGIIVAYMEIKRKKIDLKKFENMAFYAIIFGFIGARCYYVLFNLDYYLANPVVLWSHDYSIPAIGIAKNVSAEKQLEGDIVFNDKEFDEFGWSIGERVKAGVLRCGSVGFRVDECEFLEAQDRDCDLIYRKQELLEFSICCVPSNPFAIHVPQKKLEIERIIQEDDSSFYEKVCSGLKARA